MADLRIGCMTFGIAVAVCLLAGCSGPGTGVAEAMNSGIPEGLVIDPLSEGPAATWIERGESFAIVTFGSGSCPAIATGLTTDGPDRIAVTFGASPNDPCTADMAPTTHEFELPAEISLYPVTIDVSYEDWLKTDSLTLE